MNHIIHGMQQPNDWVSLPFMVGAFSEGYVNSTTRPDTFIRDVKYQGTDKNCEEEIVLTGAKQKLAQKSWQTYEKLSHQAISYTLYF